MAVHRFWRLYCATTYGPDATAVTDLFLQDPGGINRALLTLPGTAIASSINGPANNASKAFDALGPGNTYWQSAFGVNNPEWIGWDFGVSLAYDIQSFVVTNPGTVANIPNSISLQYSDDGTTWTTAFGPVTNPNTINTLTTYSLPGHDTAALNLPTPLVAAYMGGSATLYQTFLAAGYMGGSATLTAPHAVASGATGITMNLTAPLAVARGYFGINANPSMPSAVAFGLGGAKDPLLDAAYLTMPMGQVSAFGGINAATTMPTGQLAASGTVTEMFTAAVVAPSSFVTATGTVGAVFSGSPYLAMAPLSSPSAVSGNFGGSAILTMGPATLSASGTIGGLIIATIKMPLFLLVASGSRPNHGSAALFMPMGQLSPTARIALTMPSAFVVATASATVVLSTASYEAYAVNLAHRGAGAGTPQDPQVDEVTRYSTYPFDQILRFGTQYIGIGPLGLFLIGGTTDDGGVAIPWSWRTGKTDDDVQVKKRVNAAYFAGRMGANSTITIVSGENVANEATFNYTTPRGTYAQNYRQKFGRGLIARYFALAAAAATNGGDLELEGVTFDREKLTRSI